MFALLVVEKMKMTESFKNGHWVKKKWTRVNGPR